MGCVHGDFVEEAALAQKNTDRIPPHLQNRRLEQIIPGYKTWSGYAGNSRSVNRCKAAAPGGQFIPKPFRMRKEEAERQLVGKTSWDWLVKQGYLDKAKEAKKKKAAWDTTSRLGDTLDERRRKMRERRNKGKNVSRPENAKKVKVIKVEDCATLEELFNRMADAIIQDKDHPATMADLERLFNTVLCDEPEDIKRRCRKRVGLDTLGASSKDTASPNGELPDSENEEPQSHLLFPTKLASICETPYTTTPSEITESPYKRRYGEPECTTTNQGEELGENASLDEIQGMIQNIEAQLETMVLHPDYATHAADVKRSRRGYAERLAQKDLARLTGNSWRNGNGGRIGLQAS